MELWSVKGEVSLHYLSYLHVPRFVYEDWGNRIYAPLTTIFRITYSTLFREADKWKDLQYLEDYGERFLGIFIASRIHKLF